MTQQKVVRSAAPLRMQVVQLLRDSIVIGDFEPGQRLVETPLCERFGVSRTVIREAIRQLESEGLVTSVANRGPVVTELGRDDIEALYEVRAALEGLAGARFAARANTTQVKQLRQALSQVKHAFEGHDPKQRLRAKDLFYDVLLEGAGNAVIESTLRGIHARVQLLRGLSMQAPNRAYASVAELTEIVVAAEARDDVRARAACEMHVMRALAAALSMHSVDSPSR